MRYMISLCVSELYDIVQKRTKFGRIPGGSSLTVHNFTSNRQQAHPSRLRFRKLNQSNEYFLHLAERLCLLMFTLMSLKSWLLTSATESENHALQS